jgi:aminoglycoside phosphotransferase (APT) family kinase protein
MAMADADVGRALIDYLRASLGTPALDLDGPPTPLSGGFDTSIYALRLRNAPPPFSGPLVLRVLAPHHDPARARRERAIQNAVAGQGYPAPRVVAVTTDPRVLGAPFLLMEHLPGRVLVDAQRIGMGGVLAEAQARLHGLTPRPLLTALDADPGAGGRATVGFDSYLMLLEARTTRAALDGLKAALNWLRERRPAAGAPVICHGDFHPRNILVASGRVTAVVDWPNTLVADAEFDVAATLNILRFVPVDLVGVPGVVSLLARVARPILAARYLSAYRRRRSLDPQRLAYHEVATAMRALVQVGEARQRRGPALGALEASSYAEQLAARVERLAQVTVTLPTARREP